MNKSSLDLFKELDPEALQKKFLNSLLSLQNVQRGSIWIKKRESYVCTEAAGDQANQIIGVDLKVDQPSIVGWVIENKKMTIADVKSDIRHHKEVEETFAVKSSLILCFPLFLREKEVYGAVQIIDTSPEKSRLNLDKAYLETIQNLVDVCSIALSNSGKVLPQFRLQPVPSAKAAASGAVFTTLWPSKKSRIAQQSETKYPLNPHCLRNTSCMRYGCAQQGSPFVRLYAPMTPATSASVTRASKAGR